MPVAGPEAVPVELRCVLGHPEPVAHYVGFVCQRHYHWLDATLSQILELFALLPDVLVPGPGSDERGGTSVHSPAPGRLDVMALTDRRGYHYVDDPDAIPDVPGGLDTWVRLVLEERDDLDDEPDGALAVSVRILRRERHWIARQPWIDDYANDLELFHRRVARAAGESMWPRSIGACPNCTQPLYNTVGADTVTCRRCKASWTGVALVRLRLILEQESA